MRSLLLMLLVVVQQGENLAKVAASHLPAQTDQVVVSASEATLLTASNHMYHQQQERINDIHSDIELDLKSSTNDAKGPKSSPSNTMKIVDISTNCTRDVFEMRMVLNRPFHGVMYAKDFSSECRSRGTSGTNITLRLPTSGCGVRVEPRPNNDMELTVQVMLQIEEKLRQSTDILKTIHCELPQNAMGLILAPVAATTTMTTTTAATTSRASKMRTGFRNGRTQQKPNSNNNVKTSTITITTNDLNMATKSTTPTVTDKQSEKQQQQQRQQFGVNSQYLSSSTPRVRIWLELGGPGGSGSVTVGQATTLTVRAIVPGSMGVRIVDCAALDGLGESTQQLLDERGCPIDEQVMPALQKRYRPAEEGWSKQNADDLLERTYTAVFPAFKFPDRERLHVSCGVQLCKGDCPDVNCSTDEKLILSTDKHLARIDVFNSLAVTAPQIEMDRLRYDPRYNMTVEEYSPYLRPLLNDGVLCLSVSKLAISFCVLGIIFLAAVIVAIFSLIRSRRRFIRYRNSGSNGALHNNNNGPVQRTEICTSMFSSSSESTQSARFGSKIFIPYYPNTLPYGRVY